MCTILETAIQQISMPEQLQKCKIASLSLMHEHPLTSTSQWLMANTVRLMDAALFAVNH